MTKRLFDLLLSALAVLLLSPLLVATALAVWLEDGRPVLFRQVRVGRGGREFGRYKFRTMVRNAAALGPHFTARGDPRITRVGRFIRRTSRDELPQLFNVLAGDMSLVGPRPDVPAQRADYAPEDWEQRCSVRPGITGLAQAQLRSEATPRQRLDLDLAYAKQAARGGWAGLALDMRIVMWTLRRLSGRGSN